MRCHTVARFIPLVLLLASCSDEPADRLIAPQDLVLLSSSTCELGLPLAGAYAEIARLRAEVDLLEASGSLNAGQATALRNHLDNAIRQLDAGRNCPALAQLRAFRAQVGAFIEAGVLSESEGAPLIDDVNDIIGATPLVAEASVVSGWTHSCGISTSGTAYCWGWNIYGQLGTGTPDSESTPARVSGGLKFVSVHPAFQHTCALTPEGQAYCWGTGTDGQVGDGTTDVRDTPVLVTGGLTFATLTTDGRTSCGLTPVGDAYCWGNNEHGQLGDGTTTNRSSPVLVSGGLTFGTLGLGNGQACGLTTAGAAYCWGLNSTGALNVGTSDDPVTTPTAVVGGLIFTSLTVGYTHACGLVAAGEAYCWGQNALAQLGNGTQGGVSTSPGAVATTLRFSQLSAGNFHTCGIATDDNVYCWGRNSTGQVGTGNTTPSYITTPALVTGGHSLIALGVEGGHSCAMDVSGAAYCWGGNTYGQLGDGTTMDSALPVEVGGWTGVP